MPRQRRGARAPQQVNIETHRYNDMIIPQLRIAQREIDFLRGHMPFPDLIHMPIHGWMHLLHMCVYASELCNYGLFDLEVVRWGILTHDSGRYTDDLPESKHPLMGAYLATKMIGLADNKVDAQAVSNIVGRHNLTDGSLSNEEAALRAADRLDLWRLPDFPGILPELVEAPGSAKVESIAKQLRLKGGISHE